MASNDWLFSAACGDPVSAARYRQRHDVWTDLITTRGHIAWCDADTTPYMSAWCVHQRYCRLNVTTGRELLEPVDPRERCKRSREPLRSFLNPETWIPAPRRISPGRDGAAFAHLLTALRGAGLTRWGGKWTSMLAEDECIRLCPACRELGYQSVFAQVTGIARCPIHGMPYVTTCARCGAPLPPLRFDVHRDSTRCTRCGAFFLVPKKLPTSVLLQFRRRECEAWSGFAAWLDAVREKVTDCSSRLFPRRAELDEGLALQPRFLWVLDAVVPLPHDLRSFLVTRPSTLSAVSARSVAIRSRAERYKPVVGDQADDRRRVLASVRRYIMRRYIHRHPECLRRARGGFFVMSEKNGMRYTLRMEDGCYTAQAFIYWIYALKYRPTRGPYANCEPANFLKPSAANSDLRVWARQALAAFYEKFVAIRAAYLLEADASGLHAKMLSTDPDVQDVVERLELQDDGLNQASVVLSLNDGDTVVVGRGPHPDLAARSCTSCGMSRRRAVRRLRTRGNNIRKVGGIRHAEHQ